MIKQIQNAAEKVLSLPAKINKMNVDRKVSKNLVASVEKKYYPEDVVGTKNRATIKKTVDKFLWENKPYKATEYAKSQSNKVDAQVWNEQQSLRKYPVYTNEMKAKAPANIPLEKKVPEAKLDLPSVQRKGRGNPGKK
jgi:hypothetical protein